MIKEAEDIDIEWEDIGMVAITCKRCKEPVLVGDGYEDRNCNCGRKFSLFQITTVIEVIENE